MQLEKKKDKFPILPKLLDGDGFYVLGVLML